MARIKRLFFAGAFALVASVAGAAERGYLFLNPPYLSATRAVVADARDAAPAGFKGDADAVTRLNTVADALSAHVAEAQRQQRLKKVTDASLEERRDEAFATALNDFKFALNAMAEVSGKKLEDLLPSWAEWNRREVALMEEGLGRRLAAYRTRFGPDSEPVNLLEYVVSQKFLAGDEAGPSTWEPIIRVSALQATTRGPGLTSTVQLGLNRYFLKKAAPAPLQWVGVDNHVGLAAMLQYLDTPGVLEAKGKPSFGLMLHLNRKEIGVSWDNAEDRLNLTVGYAFQFVPMLM